MNYVRKYICCVQEENQISTMNNLQLPGQNAIPLQIRAKVSLAPQHGLMDWIRKMNNTQNISGTNGKILNVTEEELAKHNKKTDCWLAISGNVYNITPYLDYHPGGVDEIMRGAGIDATSLFQEVHSWVNFASMLEKCFVGRLITKNPSKEISLTKRKILPNRLRFEFSQPDEKNLILLISTTFTTLTVENIFLYIENSKKILSFIYINDFVHTISIDLFDLIIENDFSVCISTNDKSQIEIHLKKQIERMWKSIGTFQSNHLSICSIEDFQPIYFSTKLIKRISITHDTDWYTFSIPTNVFMAPLIGHHIRLKQTKNDLAVVKPYTVVNKLNNETNSSTNQTIELLIKHYKDGIFTTMLKQLNIGETIEMSSFQGTFNITKIDLYQKLVLIAAGTGLTPMIRIINYSLKQMKIKQNFIGILLFFNKTENDILCRNELETISKENKFFVHHFLSQPDSKWTGEKGQIRMEILQRFLPLNDKKNETFICVCGPTLFTNLTENLLKDFGYSQNDFHLFLG